MDLLDGSEYVIERGFVLKLAKTRSIGRTDVHDEEVSVRLKHAKRSRIIFRCLGQRSDFRFAEVDPNRMSWPPTELPPLSEPFGNDFRAGIIEAKPINDRFI